MNIKQQLAGTAPLWLTLYNLEAAFFPTVYVVGPLWAATVAVVLVRAVWRGLDNQQWSPSL